MWTLAADEETTVQETLAWAVIGGGDSVGVSARDFLVRSGVKDRKSLLWDHIANWKSVEGNQLSYRQRAKDFVDYWKMCYIEHLNSKGLNTAAAGGAGAGARSSRGLSERGSLGSDCLSAALGGGGGGVNLIDVLNYFISVEEERMRMQQQPRPSKTLSEGLQPSVRSSRPATSLARLGYTRAALFATERSVSSCSLPPLAPSSRPRAFIELPPKLQQVAPYADATAALAPDPQLRGLTSRGRMFSLAQSWAD
jgi:hypothetical protein